jgi:hypothetical protein
MISSISKLSNSLVPGPSCQWLFLSLFELEFKGANQLSSKSMHIQVTGMSFHEAVFIEFSNAGIQIPISGTNRQFGKSDYH